MAGAEVLEPTVIGRYALFDSIAVGGMASVHFGLHVGPGGFSRTVVVKRLHPGFADHPDFVAMLMDEARLVARVRHPNVVPVIDVVEFKNELLLVMEYVHGESLSKILSAARARHELVPVPIAATILADVLEGLHAAHEATNENGEPLCMVHRDVSPQNVMVGVDGVARAVDFGIAKAARRLQVTEGDQLKGKLGYMAPEQLEHHPFDRHVDVWASSVMLWETLTAKRLFDDETPGKTCARILRGDIQPPGTFRPDLPAGLDEVVMQGLRVNPKERFATARLMAQALEAVVPRVTAREVGAWVHTVAKDAIDARAERLKQIEALCSKMSFPSLAPIPPATGLSGAEQTHTASAVITSSTRTKRARGVAVAIAIGSAVALGLAVVLAITLPRSSHSFGSDDSAVAPAAPSALAPPNAVDRSSATGSANPLGLDGGVVASASAARSAEAAPPTSTAVATKGRAHPTLPAPTVNCNPPYTIDKQGVRVPKPQCYP